jgi:REP element-mobilizing transposase RayT
MCRVAPIFFTVNTYRQTFLTDVDVRSALRAAIGTLRSTHPFVIEAWVLLLDHMLALWTLPPEMRVSPTVGVSSTGWSRSVAKPDSID